MQQKGKTEMTFTCAWYFEKMPSAKKVGELFLLLANTLPFKINRTLLFDDSFVTKKPRFTEENIINFVTAASYKTMFAMLADSRITGEDNRVPRCQISLERISYGGPDTFCISIAIDANKLAVKTAVKQWHEIITTILKTRYGAGSEHLKYNELSGYLRFRISGTHLSEEGKTPRGYNAATINNSKLDDATTLQGVLAGTQLRSVFEINLISVSMHDLLKKVFSKHNHKMPGTTEELHKNFVLWHVPTIAARKKAFTILQSEGLLFDEKWFEQKNYMPGFTEFGIPFKAQ